MPAALLPPQLLEEVAQGTWIPLEILLLGCKRECGFSKSSLDVSTEPPGVRTLACGHYFPKWDFPRVKEGVDGAVGLWGQIKVRCLFLPAHVFGRLSSEYTEDPGGGERGWKNCLSLLKPIFLMVKPLWHLEKVSLCNHFIPWPVDPRGYAYATSGTIPKDQNSYCGRDLTFNLGRALVRDKQRKSPRS